MTHYFWKMIVVLKGRPNFFYILGNVFHLFEQNLKIATTASFVFWRKNILQKFSGFDYWKSIFHANILKDTT